MMRQIYAVHKSHHRLSGLFEAVNIIKKESAMRYTSLTIFKNEWGQKVAKMIRHDDGDIECHGKELADFLKGISIGCAFGKEENGRWNPLSEKGGVENMECLAAQAVAYFTTRSKGIYLLPDKGHDFHWFCSYTIQVPIGRAVKPIIEVEGTCGRHDNVVFRGTAEEMLSWLKLFKKGFMKEDHAVRRVITPMKGDFGDQFPYLYFAEKQPSTNIRHGSEMSESIQKLPRKFSRYGGAERSGYAIIACIGEQDDLEERIGEAHAFAGAPASIWEEGLTIVFWAAKWDAAVWDKHKASFVMQGSPRKTVILKRIGEDPMDPTSGEVLPWRPDRLDALFNATAQHEGYEVL